MARGFCWVRLLDDREDSQIHASPFMRYLIHARDRAGTIVLKRDTIEAAIKKAEEMRSLGWFDVEVIEQSIEKSKAA